MGYNFETKIKVLLADDLLPWQELNVTSFLMSGIATQDIVGLPYKDASGQEYLPMSQQPIMVYSGTRDRIKEVLKKSVEKGFKTAIFTQELFNTFNDEDNRAAVEKIPTNELNLVGIAVIGKKNQVDKLFKEIHLHT